MRNALILLLVASALPAAAADTASALPVGIGPGRKALALAQEWREDSCLSGVEFNRLPTQRGFHDVFGLFFHAESEPRETFNYSSSSDGGDSGGPGPRRGDYMCIAEFELDAKTALAKATASGLRLGADGSVHMILSRLDADQVKYLGNGMKGSPEAARTIKALRRSIDKPVWNIMADRHCAIIDAVTGETLMLSRSRAIMCR